MKKEILKFLVLFITGIVILGIIVISVGIENIIISLNKMSIYYYGVVATLILAGSFTWALRWGVFVKEAKSDINKKDLFEMTLIGQAVNNLTPIVKMGGEAARVYLLKKNQKIKAKDGFASVASDLTMEFIIDLIIVISALVLLIIFFNPPTWIYAAILIFTIVSSLIVFVILEIYFNFTIIHRILIFITDHIKSIKTEESEIIKKYDKFRKTFRKSLTNKRLLSKGLGLSFLRKVFDVMKYYILLAALGAPLNLTSIFIAVGLSIMLLLIPGIPGNIGIYEGGMIAVFSFMGVSSSIAFTAVFLDRLIWYWGITGIGSMLGAKYGMELISKKRSKKNLENL